MAARDRIVTPVKHLKTGDVIADLTRGMIVVETKVQLVNGGWGVYYKVQFTGEYGRVNYSPHSEVLVVK